MILLVDDLLVESRIVDEHRVQTVDVPDGELRYVLAYDRQYDAGEEHLWHRFDVLPNVLFGV